MRSAVSLAREKFGRLDLAVNCAGIAVAVKTYNFKKDVPHSLEDFIRIINVSVPHHSSHCSLPSHTVSPYCPPTELHSAHYCLKRCPLLHHTAPCFHTLPSTAQEYSLLPPQTVPYTRYTPSPSKNVILCPCMM